MNTSRRYKILFVCLGNICRSPAAQGVMQEVVDSVGDSARWLIDSAGTGRYHIGQLPDSRMRSAGRVRGYEFDHRCRQVNVSDFSRFDMIVAMDDSNYADLCSMAPSPEAERKIVKMNRFLSDFPLYDHVPDPYYEGAEGFELVLDMLQSACQKIYACVTQSNYR